MKNTEKKMRVLIADDNAPTRMLLRAATTRWNYEVVEAKDGEEVLEIMQQESPPELLILDWIMPKIDGITACKRIKTELPDFHYIILLTRMSGAENVAAGFEAGADEFLPKPFNMVELQSRLMIGSRIVGYKKEIADQKRRLKEIDSAVNKLIAKSDTFTATMQENDKMQFRKTMLDIAGITKEK